MKIKTTEASGRVLDWLTAKADGVSVKLSPTGFLIYTDKSIPTGPQGRVYEPSTNPAQAWPIIERMRPTIADEGELVVCSLSRPAKVKYESGEAMRFCTMRGETILIAAMRCYVASKLGDEVDIPEELL